MSLGICRPSNSSWASPTHIVRKKNGEWRICSDYRRLNAITIPDKYPIPHLHDFTANVAGKTVFLVLDLYKAYHQIPVAKDDVPKTAVITPFGLFEFVYMTFGLRNAAQSFQRYIHRALQDLDFVFVYIDDILIASSSEEEHKNHLRIVFQRLKKYGLFINPTKCTLGAQEVTFLGHVVNQDGIKPISERVAAIQNWPKPRTIADLRRFLGALNFYRRSLKQVARIQAPLHCFLTDSRKNDKREITWTPDAKDAFVKAKSSLANAALLAHPSNDSETRIGCFELLDGSSSPRQLRQLSFIAQFSTDIGYLPDPDNLVADSLSRIEALRLPTEFELVDLASRQKEDEELQHLLASDKSSLKLKKFVWGSSNSELYCELSREAIRPYIPVSLRKQIFDLFHNPAHPSAKVTDCIIRQRYIWPNLHRDVALWANNCIDCQQSKPEAIPLADISAQTVAKAFHDHWITRFGAPQTLTTDQGTQFESQLFAALLSLVGCKRVRPTAYHSASNGMIERWHRSLKAALMCHGTENWVNTLPTVLLGLRTHVHLDTMAFPAEFVYGTVLRVPGEFFLQDDFTPDPQIFISEFCEFMRQIKPVPVTHHHKKRAFFFKELNACSHVFLCTDAVKKPLERPYSEPFRIIKRDSDKVFTLDVNNRPISVSTERLKPAHFLLEDINSSSRCSYFLVNA
ncbi:uncharacterized protein LOC113005865 [Solenopsis invicta]|uniref:uncharacterized protein LOC113005865 n=1 Tax=Solenopsis invicta TaxID=13686 RepID=UPI00193E3C82|nr:uncharacterized protein LOC113005865 [Solenopsis invicta]